MTKAEVILNAINSGATDEELLVLDNTPEDQFTVEVEEEEEEEVITAPEVKGETLPAGATEDVVDGASTGEDDSSVTPETEFVPSVPITKDGYDYKFEVGDDNYGVYYTKKEGDKDWINVTENQKGTVAEVSIASEFGHAPDFDKEAYLKQKAEEEKPMTEYEARELALNALPTKYKMAGYLSNAVNIIKDLITKPEEREQTLEAAQAAITNVKPRLFKTALQIQTGIVDLTTRDLTGMQNPEIRDKAEEFMKEKYKEIAAVEKYLIKDTGEGIVKGIKQGDASDFIGGIINANTSMVETVVPAMLTGGVSLPFQVIAPMYSDYNEAKAKAIYGENDPEAMDKLIDNEQTELAIPATLGLFATGLEYIGFKGITKYMFSNPGARGFGAKLLLTGNKEGLTEWGQGGIEQANIAFGEGKDSTEAGKALINNMFSEAGVESYLNGFVGASGMTTAGSAINRALRSDNASIKEVNDKINNLADLNYKKNKTRNKDVKEALDVEIKEAEQDLRDYINEKRKLNKVLTTEEKTSLVDILNEKNGVKEKIQSLKTQLQNKEITNKEFGYAIRSLNNQDKKLSDQLSEIQTAAITRAAEKVTETIRKQVGAIADEQGVEGAVTEATGQEILDLQGEKLARLTAERDSNQEVLDDPNQTAENKKVAEENVKDLQRQIDDVNNADATFGYIDEKIDDKGDLTGDFEIVINKDKPMIGTAAHEFMHKVLFKTLKSNKDLQTNVGDAVTTFINEEKGGFQQPFINRMTAYISPIKDKNGKVVRDKDGNVQYEKVSEFGEEVVTVMSESILDGSLKYNENFWTKIGDIIRQNLQRYGFKSIQFNSGRDVYNFIKDFNKSIEKDYTSKAITEAAVKGIKGKLVEGKEKVKQSEDLATQDSDSVKRETYETTNDDGETITVVITTAKDGSRSVRYITSDGDIYSRDKFGKNNTLTNEEIIDKTVLLEEGADITNIETIEGFENIANPKVVAKRKAEAEAKRKKVKKTKPKAKRKMSKVSPRADQFIKAEINNEMLVDITRSPSSSKEDSFGAIEALVEKNWPIISKSLKFNPTGDITMASIKEVVSEQMLGIFPKITLPDGKKINREGKRLLDTYNKETKVTTFLDATLRNRQAEIFTRAKTIDAVSQGVSLEEAKNIAVSTELENETSNQNDTRKRINVLKIPKVARVAKEIRRDTKIEEGDTHKQVTKNNEGHIGKKIFNVPEIKITKPNENLTTSDDIVDVKTGEIVTKEELDAGATGILSPSESKNIQDVFSDYETSEQFIKILPKTNVSEKDALVNEIGENIPVSRDVYGRAIGLQDRILEYFYEPLIKPNGKRARSQGKTSQVPLWTLKEEFVNPKKDVVVQFQRDLGITERKQVNVLPTKEKRSEIGQLLKGAARTLSQQVSLSAAQRNLEAMGAPKQQIADITAAQRRRAYSKEADKITSDIIKYVNTKPGDLSKQRKIPTAPKEEVYLEKTVDGEFVDGKIITRKALDSYYDKENKITWEKYLADKISNFIENNPQYYNIIQETFTGGIKRAAFFTKPYFEKVIPRSKKVKETKQIEVTKNPYNKPSPKGQKGKRFVGVKNLDLSIDKNKIDNLINIYKNIGKNLSKDKDNIDIFEEMLLHFGIDQNNFARKSAPLIGYPVDDNGKPIKNQAVVEEHAPQMEMQRIMLNAAYNGKINDVVPVIKATYSQISILEVDDPGGKLKTSMGKDFYNNIVPRIIDGNLDWLPPGYASIYRLMKAGVNPFGYKLIGPKQTIAEYFSVSNLNVEKARQAIVDVFEGKQDIKVLRAQSGIKYSKDIDNHNKLNKAIAVARKSSKDPKGITVLDFDDTLATTESLVKYTRPDGKTGTLNAEEYASTYEDLLGQGYTFDFSEFNKVVKGKIAPLFQKALKLQSKFGPENMFVLTARPPAAQKAIFDFLKANGLNIPIKNITGLANSTSEAKALWMADKVGEGYNDFYFADDALQNVQAVKNMLDQFDVKSKVQQAKLQFSKNMNENFNDILENVTGIESKKRFSDIKARKRGADKGKFRFFIPPSHEDFVGLLYNFMGKGKEGNAHRDFWEKSLIRPLNRADRELNTAKQSIANDYKSLNKQFKDVKKKLTKKTPDGDFTNQDAIRVYLWNKHGHKIPGLSPTDQTKLTELVTSDPQLQAYAETLNIISKQDAYVKPNESWNAGDIRTDLDDATGRVGRADFFTEFNENSEIIFSQENLNKIEAAYGADVVSAIKDILYRIKTGQNRPSGQNKQTNQWLNYLNGSVAATMFFNIRSAVLQQMSMVNFINFSDNNILAAAKSFANQKQYWKDYATIFNSDFMKQRRKGIQTDVNGAELAASVKGAKNPAQAVIKKLLELGFLPTQIGDNNAIALGGATYYRNRINTYLKQGMTQKEAESKAWIDFQVLAEATQQSAKPWMISMQQASPLGKVILAFQNVTSQFNRLGKKAFLDIKNRRISPEYKNASNPQLQSDMSNASRIAYYFAVQNLIFYSLQTALFSAMFSDDEDDERMLAKKERIINGTLDSVLRGSGVWGAAASTLKNMAIAYHKEREKDWNGDEASVLVEALNVSPPLGIKARKIVNAERTLNYNKDVMEEMGTFDIDNPQWSAYTSYTEAITNIPLNRLYNKTQNVRQSLDNQHAAYQRALMFSGWSQWNLGLGDTEKIEEVKETIKVKKKVIAKEKAKVKKAEKKIQTAKENEAKIEVNKKKSKKDGVCSAIGKGGERCGNKIVSGKSFCTVHESTVQRKDGKETQCKKTKKDGKRCGMQTSNKSGYCYYHD